MTNSTARAIRPGACARCGTDLSDPRLACPSCGLSTSAGTATFAAPASEGPRAQRSGELASIAAALAAEYDVTEELGRGGMAIVFRARDVALQREVALKVLPLTHTLDAEFVERFQQEARTAAQLEHPHIVPIHRVATLGGVTFFTMKLLRGRTLSDLLYERHRLPAAEVRRLLREVGSALAYASKQGVVHRDIKPDNIMCDDDGRFVVTDFGIARSAAAPRLTATGMSVGTPRYMSPEQARAKPLDGRSDIYSLGVVAYQCLAGRVPFEGDEAFAILYSHIHSPPPRPVLASAEEWELFEIVERMLAKTPARRVQDGDELVRLMDALVMRARIGTAATTGGGLPVTVASRALDRAVPHVRFRLGRMWSRTRDAAGACRNAAIGVVITLLSRVRSVPGVQLVIASWGRSAIAGALAVITIVVGGHVVHALVHHDTRCPPATFAGPLTVDGWTVLLDTPPARSVGDALVVHYDVCGMERQSAYSVQLTVARSGGALRRLLGGPSPVVTSYDERAASPASRGHRRVNLETLPAGSYSVELEVTDAGGRRRRASRELRIEE